MEVEKPRQEASAPAEESTPVEESWTAEGVTVSGWVRSRKTTPGGHLRQQKNPHRWKSLRQRWCHVSENGSEVENTTPAEESAAEESTPTEESSTAEGVTHQSMGWK